MSDEMDFDGVSSIIINNKVVNSIVRAKDNVIVYQKPAVQYDYIVNNVTDLVTALESIQEGESLYIEEGTYTLTKHYGIPACTIVGNNATLKPYGFLCQATSTETYDISGITFDGTGVDRGDTGLVYCGANANIHIHDCHFTNVSQKWNAINIRIAYTNTNYTIEIDHCLFDGPNTTSSYGHTKASIAAFQLGTVYNLDIHHNTFNHPSGGSNTVRNGKAIACINNYNCSSLVNCKAYCNQYLGTGDRNDCISESSCPD